ncbi:hypothetical protein [Sodalis sp.]|uniref:hypothetical protein n=1 Tax=Sodalis sp. (in: enterobacteria) TaxID=1898979 RepID=UPI003873CADB
MLHVLNVKYDMGPFHDIYVHLGSTCSDPADINARKPAVQDRGASGGFGSLVLLKPTQRAAAEKQGTLSVISPLAD